MTASYHRETGIVPQVFLHPFRILIVDDFQQLLQFQAYILYLSGRTGIEQNFLEQIIVLAQQAFGNGHMLFERSTRGFLMLHDRCKHKS